MSLVRPRLEWRAVVLSVLALAGIAGLAVNARPPADERPAVGPDSGEVGGDVALPARLAALDAAIARRDATGAAIEWRAAHALALRARRWETLLAVGDAALRVDALVRDGATKPTGFQAEARQAYLRALFQARAERSQEGMQRAADAFAALGDAEMATRARALGMPR
jgi:hypothetical protein